MPSRKAFLLTTALTAALPGAAAAATGGHPFDRARFEARLARDAKHRQCFGVTKLEGGTALANMYNSIYAYEVTLNEGSGALHAAAVLYHGTSIVMAFDHATWNGLIWPSKLLTQSDLGKDAWRAKHRDNPFYGSAARDESTVQALSKRHGASFFVCNNAVTGMASEIAGALKLQDDAVYARLLGGIVPEAMVVPAGVMAINACQEAKFTYIQATL
jgi:intracellular sulfur oxidation DsrE/DsrF family protein